MTSIETWLPELRVQLETTQSHVNLLEKLGYERATIAVFEAMSRINMPFNLQSIVTKIGPNGDPKIEEQIIGYEGCTKELKDYSKIAVIYAIKQLPGYHKKISNIRKVIRVCLVEMRNHPELPADIVIAAKTKARLATAEKRLAIEPIVFKDIHLNLPSGQAEGRPIDWENSHWWSGE